MDERMKRMTDEGRLARCISWSVDFPVSVDVKYRKPGTEKEVEAVLQVSGEAAAFGAWLAHGWSKGWVVGVSAKTAVAPTQKKKSSRKAKREEGK